MRKGRTLKAFFSNTALLIEFIKVVKTPDDQKGGLSRMWGVFEGKRLNNPPFELREVGQKALLIHKSQTLASMPTDVKVI